MQQSSQPISKKITANREVFRTQIRSKKTEEIFLSKRLKFQEYIEEDIHSRLSDDLLLSQLLETTNMKEICEFLEVLRKRSCEIEKNNVFLKNEKLVILIPILIKFLDNEELQYNSCWILINILIGDTTLIKYCIKTGLLDAFLEIIEKKDVVMRELVI